MLAACSRRGARTRAKKTREEDSTTGQLVDRHSHRQEAEFAADGIREFVKFVNSWIRGLAADGAKRQTSFFRSGTNHPGLHPSTRPRRDGHTTTLGPVYAMLRRLTLLLLAILSLVAPSYTYIPAVNSTAQGVADTEDSTITLKWPSGTFQETISYQLAANNSMGISKVRFPFQISEQTPSRTAPGGPRPSP